MRALKISERFKSIQVHALSSSSENNGGSKTKHHNLYRHKTILSWSKSKFINNNKTSEFPNLVSLQLPSTDTIEPSIEPYLKPINLVESLAELYQRIEFCTSQSEKVSLYVELFSVFCGLGDQKLLRRCLRTARQNAEDVMSKVVLSAWLRFERRDDELVGISSMDCGGYNVLECPKKNLENGFNPFSINDHCKCNEERNNHETCNNDESLCLFDEESDVLQTQTTDRPCFCSHPNNNIVSAMDASSELHDVTHLFQPINLKELPHLNNYIPNLQPQPNPLDQNPYFHTSQHKGFYITQHDVVFSHSTRFAYRSAGPRDTVYFNPSDVKVAIVTCGGLCPGLNTVIRELVVGLWNLYGVRHIFGITAGYRGFYSTEPLPLNPNIVSHWHSKGGTFLQTSRGGFDLCKIVDSIQNQGFNQVYIIGGDGTMRGAVKIFNEIQQRKLNIAVVGIPKTVDNDIGIIDRSFGFQTAVEMAQQAISAAHVEAESAVNGIGLVKLMGRSTGHIALHATLSSRDVDCCLIPELDFYLEGKGGLFEFLDQRLKENGRAVLVVAEGAGQDIISRTDSQKEERDESGNLVFLDVGVWLKSELKKWWDRDHPGELFTVKYIDPTYMIRAVHANATDNLYCTLLAHSAIHGVMAGYTGFVAGPINGNYAYIPLEDVACAKNPVNTKDHNWSWVRSVTNQPDFLKS